MKLLVMTNWSGGYTTVKNFKDDPRTPRATNVIRVYSSKIKEEIDLL